MFELYLFSKNPITLILNNTKIEVSNKSSKVLKFDSPKSFDFDLYFTNNPSSIFHIGCYFDDVYKTDSDLIKIVKINEQKYIFKFLMQNECFLQKKCKKIIKNNQIFYFYQNGLVEIETTNLLLFSQKYDFEIVDAEVLELKNYCALKLFGKNETEKSIVLNENFAEIISFDSCIIEETEQGFKVLTNLYDIACHGLVESFEIADDIKKIDEYSVYMFDQPRREFNVNVLPIYFLQCVRAGDFVEASKCLSNELKSKAKREHLAQYFGDFVDIYKFDDKIYLEYVDSANSRFVQQFSFKIEGGKISNIS